MKKNHVFFLLGFSTVLTLISFSVCQSQVSRSFEIVLTKKIKVQSVNVTTDCPKCDNSVNINEVEKIIYYPQSELINLRVSIHFLEDDDGNARRTDDITFGDVIPNFQNYTSDNRLTYNENNGKFKIDITNIPVSRKTYLVRLYLNPTNTQNSSTEKPHWSTQFSTADIIANPVGSVVPYFGDGSDAESLEVEGWYLCDGRNINELPHLFMKEKIQLMEILYRAGNKDFNRLPDLQGTFLRGATRERDPSHTATNDPDYNVREMLTFPYYNSTLGYKLKYRDNYTGALSDNGWNAAFEPLYESQDPPSPIRKWYVIRNNSFADALAWGAFPGKTRDNIKSLLLDKNEWWAINWNKIGSSQLDNYKQHNHGGETADAGRHSHGGTTQDESSHTHSFSPPSGYGYIKSGTTGANVTWDGTWNQIMDGGSPSSAGILDGTNGEPDLINQISTGSSSTGSGTAHSHVINEQADHKHTINNAGGSETRPRNVLVNYLIRARK